jgi:hypothetical protein
MMLSQRLARRLSGRSSVQRPLPIPNERSGLSARYH